MYMIAYGGEVLADSADEWEGFPQPLSGFGFDALWFATRASLRLLTWRSMYPAV